MIHIKENTCDFCGACVAICPPDCIELYEAEIVIVHEKCTNCKLCVWVCPIEVLEHSEAA